MVLVFHSTSPIYRHQPYYKRAKKKEINSSKENIEVLTLKNRQYLKSLGFEVLV